MNREIKIKGSLLAETPLLLSVGLTVYFRGLMNCRMVIAADAKHIAAERARRTIDSDLGSQSIM